ncbi:MAG: hypothetical protein H7Y33_03590 [Cytophagales bacterium]|nr:hypothetical protein [Rhizobacter sp.]
MKRSFFLIPMLLPKLSDRAAVQLIDILAQLMDCVQQFYAPQIDRWRHQNRHLKSIPPRHKSFSKLDDEPF